MDKGASGAALVSYLRSVKEPGQDVSDSGSCEEYDESISGHVQNAQNSESGHKCQADTYLIFFFFCRRAESVDEARIIVYGWRQALKVSERGSEKKGPSDFFSRSVSQVLHRI